MVQVPDMPPIRNNITIAVVTSPILLRIASSKSCHGFLKSHIASHTQIPAENSSETWLAPRIASLPKKLMFNANNMISIMIGINEIPVLMTAVRFISSSIAD